MSAGLKGLLASRKAWALAVAWVSGMLIQLLAVIAPLKGWPPEQVAAWTSWIHLGTYAAFAAGGLLAAAWAWESGARGWGVTEAPPEELRMRAAAVKELQERLSPEVLQMMKDLSAPTQKRQVD